MLPVTKYRFAHGHSFRHGLGMTLCGVAVAAQNPKLHFEVKEINFTDDEHAKVGAILHSSGLYATKDTSEKVSFEMVKEGSDWFMVEDFSLF